MSAIGALLDRAEMLHLAGQAAEAAALYREALGREPGNPRALHRYGLLIYQSGQPEPALRFLEAAAAISPGDADYLSSLADCRRALGDDGGAEAIYRRALLMNAAHAPTLNNLGMQLTETGRAQEALPLLETASILRDDLPEIRNSLGLAFSALGDPTQAVAAYHAALRLRPDYPEALNNLGLSLQAMGDKDGAMAALERALALRPDFVGALNNLGSLCQSTGRSAAAVGYYRAALQRAPQNFSLWLNLGNALKQQGLAEAAVEAYGEALALSANIGIELKQALAMKPIQDSAATIARDRARLLATLAELDARAAELPDPLGQLGETAFFTAYHGEDDRALLSQLVDTLIRACPSLSERLVDRGSWRRLPLSRRLKIGFLSKFLRNHTIGKLYGAVIESLPRDRFEVVVLRQVGPGDALSARIEASADRIVPLPGALEQARMAVASENLDLLFYPELGMDPFSWFLAFARLAPVQAVGWGHPVTSGSPAMDYFVSGGGFEAAGASKDYREKLVSVRGPGVRYVMPAIDRGLSRTDLGLPTDKRIYACPQSLYKFHPESDCAWARILTRDPDAALVIVEAPEPSWSDQLRARFRDSLGPAADRVLFLPRLPEARFAAIYAQCDVALDPPFFGSGNTTLEAFAAGAPVITCPSRFMRTRLTAAFYGEMGVDDAPIADSLARYADLAVDIACDPARRRDLSTRILAAMPRLFDRADVVQDYADFFEAAIRAAHAGQPRIAWGDPT